jgi:hypothetical protein
VSLLFAIVTRLVNREERSLPNEQGFHAGQPRTDGTQRTGWLHYVVHNIMRLMLPICLCGDLSRGAGEIAPYQLLYISCETLDLKIQTWGRLGRAKPSDQSAGCSGRGLAFEMCFDLFQRLALGFRKEEDNGDEVDDGERSEEKEHGRVAVFGDEGQKDTGQDCGNKLIDEQGDAHAVGADSGGHELRQRQPYADTGAHGAEGHEAVKADGNQPAVMSTGHLANDGLSYFERRGAGCVEIREGILEEGLDRVGGYGGVAGDLNGRGGDIVRADEAGSSSVIAV